VRDLKRRLERFSSFDPRSGRENIFALERSEKFFRERERMRGRGEASLGQITVIPGIEEGKGEKTWGYRREGGVLI